MVKEEACVFYRYENPTLLSSGKLETKGFCVVSWNRFIAGFTRQQLMPEWLLQYPIRLLAQLSPINLPKSQGSVLGLVFSSEAEGISLAASSLGCAVACIA